MDLKDDLNYNRSALSEPYVNYLRLETNDWSGSGILITKNNNTYTANGTATAQANCYIGETPKLTGTFKITGCPSGGNSSTYSLQIQENGTWKYVEDGSGRIVILTDAILRFFIIVRQGVTVNNVIYKPQITLDLDGTYSNLYPSGDFLQNVLYSETVYKHWQYIHLLIGNENLNDILYSGVYYGTGSFVNAPLETMPVFRLEVYDNGLGGSYKLQILTIYLDNSYAVYTRYRFGATPTWSYWSKGFSQEDYNHITSLIGSEYGNISFNRNNTLFKNGNNIITGQKTNVGTKICIMTYNVAEYTKDSQNTQLQFLTDEKRHNFKKMLSMILPDFICLQEDSEYIDGIGTEYIDGRDTLGNYTKPSLTYLYNPVFPYVYGKSATTIRSKYPSTSGNIMKYKNSGRWIRYGLFDLNGKTFYLYRLIIHRIIQVTKKRQL